MVVGEERRAWVPAGLTSTGENGQKGDAATVDLELLEVIKAPVVPPDLQSPPAAALKMPSGLILRILKPGKGTQHPTAHSHVKVHFSGWKRDGRLIESSIMAQHAVVFEMAGVIRGWREALVSMVT